MALHENLPRKGNIISRYVDPIRNAKSMEGNVLLAETLAKLFAVLLTSAGFYIWGKDIAAQYVSWVPAHYATGLIFAGIAAWITDFAFSEFLENSMFQFFAFWKFDWVGTAIARDGWYITFVLKPLRWVVVTLVVAGLFWADYTSVYTLSSPIANAKKVTVERVDFSELRADQQRSISGFVGPIDKEVSQVRADIADAERRVISGNASLYQLAANGNSWAKSKLAAKKSNATRDLKKRLAAIQEQRDKAYAEITNSIAQERNIALADDQLAQNMEKDSKEAISSLFTKGGIGLKILTILFRLFLVINFLINTPDWDANRDGIIDGNDVSAAATGTPPPAVRTGSGNSPAFAERRRAGFVRHDDPPQPRSRTDFYFGGPTVPPPVPITGLPTVPLKNTVEQCTTAEQAERTTEQPTTQATVLADVKYWEKRAIQCFGRYYTQQRDEKRLDNKRRCECYLGMLSSVGVLTEVDFHTQHLKIEHPAKYTFQPWSLEMIEANKRELATIGKQQAYA